MGLSDLIRTWWQEPVVNLLNHLAAEAAILKGQIAMLQTELEGRLAAAADLQQKILDEVQAATAALRAEIAALGVVSPAAEAQLVRLEALQAVADGLNPDAVPAEPGTIPVDPVV